MRSQAHCPQRQYRCSEHLIGIVDVMGGMRDACDISLLKIIVVKVVV